MTILEHANITVRSIEQTLQFLAIVAPDFRLRHRGETPQHHWVHVGNNQHYLALQEPRDQSRVNSKRIPYHQLGVNHWGLQVENLDEIETELIAAGYRRSMATPNETYRRRLYFFDHSGLEWELIEYFSQRFEQRYHYE
ncbi:VOC family protein [Celerinatantimonas yamalensis]|uniref:VOC family protein n=1 Tax=Celerinatantimonas yamalensis TaxID=559956 RepID=A0ABW9G974_9GAMM